jgi:pyrroline-5-carboxylate reductase
MMNIAIIGCGNMGLTYAKAFLKDNIVTQEKLLLIEKNAELKERLKIFGNVSNCIDERIESYGIIIICVKPQDASWVYNDLHKFLKSHQLVISIMAGITLASLQLQLKHPAIIRAMPNTPAQLGMGITGYTATRETGLQQILKADNLLNSTGKTIFFENERMIDAVTAISGSGPAYFYYIVKAMIDAGKQLGMDEHVAALLVKQTMNGAFHPLNASEHSPEQLITHVASKGGTTEAALQVFEERGVSSSIIEAIIAAEKRAVELAKF